MMSKAIVLLAESSPTQAVLTKMQLEEKGYRVVVASNGVDSLTKAVEVRPNLIILDMDLPGLNSFEVCEQLKQHPMASLRSVPIIMFSSDSNLTNMTNAYNHGADYFITRSNYDNDLIMLLAELVLGRKQRLSLQSSALVYSVV